MASFATPAQLVQCYDFRMLGQLITDTGVAADEGDILANDITEAFLEQASGKIVMYAVQGGRYTEADLLAMTGMGAAILVRLTCDICIWEFVLRRGLPVDAYPQVLEAEKILAKLAKGDVVFPIPAVIAAGHAQSPELRVQTIVNNNMLVDSVAYFPTRRLTTRQ
jgi:phage gp36-like protein